MQQYSDFAPSVLLANTGKVVVVWEHFFLKDLNISHKPDKVTNFKRVWTSAGWNQPYHSKVVEFCFMSDRHTDQLQWKYAPLPIFRRCEKSTCLNSLMHAFHLVSLGCWSLCFLWSFHSLDTQSLSDNLSQC